MTMRYQGTHGHHSSNITGPGLGSVATDGVVSLVKSFTNSNGSNLIGGDVVKLKLSGDFLIEKTSVLNDPLTLGVVFGAGPFANGAATPVALVGYCDAVAVTGAVARGDYLCASATLGKAQAQSPSGTGALGRALTAAAAGFVKAYIFEAEIGGGGGGSTITETAGPTVLNAGAIPNGTFFKRVGTNFVGIRLPVGTEYDPRMAPSSPNAANDEFDDLSLAGAWTTTSSGGGSSGTVDETIWKGFARIPVVDGGAGSSRGMWKAWTAPAGVWTVVGHGYGDVNGAGSNQVNLSVDTAAGAWVFTCGMLQGNAWMINQPGGFSSHARPGITGNTNEFWLIIHHDSGSGIDGYISHDGYVWTRLTGVGGTAAVGRIRLDTWAFSSSLAQGWWDFVRAFPGMGPTGGGIALDVFTVGGTP